MILEIARIEPDARGEVSDFLPIFPSRSEAVDDAMTFVAEPVRSAPAVVPMKVRRSIFLVPELPLAREHHRDVVLVRRSNDFIVAH